MVDLEQLRARGLQAYEVGRLRMAARAAYFLVPASALCWTVSPDRELCGCIALLLVSAVIWLRWRDRRGAEDATAGLIAGSLPFVAGLLLARFSSTCGGPLCLALSAITGAVGGGLVALTEKRLPRNRSSWIAATAIAAAAAALGCTPLGVFGIIGVVFGVTMGSGLGASVVAR